jgi:hypothetical protein
MKATGPSALVEGLHKQAHPDPSHIKSFIHTTTRHGTSNQHLILAIGNLELLIIHESVDAILKVIKVIGIPD